MPLQVSNFQIISVVKLYNMKRPERLHGEKVKMLLLLCICKLVYFTYGFSFWSPHQSTPKSPSPPSKLKKKNNACINANMIYKYELIQERSVLRCDEDETRISKQILQV